MWIFSKKGFFSIVEVRGYPGTFLVRSRYRGHLESLFPGDEIEESDTIRSDYRFRIRVNRFELEDAIVRRILGEIDYTNFKGTLPAGPYKARVQSIWWQMKNEQENEERAEAMAYAQFKLPKGEGHGKGKKVRRGE